jgi:Domain of unknown function (DUF3291)
VSRIAISTCAVLRHPYDHPTIEPFEELTTRVYVAAEPHPAFVCRADNADDWAGLAEPGRDWGRWGQPALPARYAAEFGDGPYRAAQTLSIWRDLDGVRDFVYSGLHVTALRRRHEWFQPVGWPTYVVWWVDGVLPTWQDAAHRFDLLAQHGPSAQAFDLRHPFDAPGPPGTSGPGHRLVTADSGPEPTR